MVGQALVANQMGSNYMNLPAAMNQPNAASMLFKAENQTYINALTQAGITRAIAQRAQNNDMNAIKIIESQQREFAYIMQAYGDPTDYMGMHTDKFLDFVYRTYSGAGAPGSAQGIESNFGMSASANKISSDLQSTLKGYAGIGSGDPETATGWGYNQTVSQIASANKVKAMGDTIGAGFATAALETSTSKGSSGVESMMLQLQKTKKWADVGAMINGKPMDIAQIMRLPESQREELEIAIASGAIPIIHKATANGKWQQGRGNDETLQEYQGIQGTITQQSFGAPGSMQLAQSTFEAQASYQGASQNVIHTIELGKTAQQLFALVQNPIALEKAIQAAQRRQGN